MAWDPTSVISTVLGSVGNLIGIDMTNKSASDNTDKSIQATRALQKDQNDFNLDMWNRANEYNSPQAIYDRYKQAGLNPSFFMSEGGSTIAADTISASQQGQLASQGANFDASQLGNSFLNGYNLYLQKKSLDLSKTKLNQDIQESNARISKLAAETTQINIDNESRSIINDETIKNLQEQAKKTAAETAAIWDDRRLKQAQRKFQLASANESKQRAITEQVMRKYNIQNIVADTLNKKSQVRLNDEHVKLVGQQITQFILSNGEQAANLDLEGVGLSIKKNTDNSLAVDVEVKNSDEYKETAKRGGYSRSQEVQNYVNGILGTITTVGTTLLLRQGMRGIGQGSQQSVPYPDNTSVSR